jgi:hypothetical protein
MYLIGASVRDGRGARNPENRANNDSMELFIIIAFE